MTALHDWPSDLTLPQRYTAERVLGRGAFGVVVLAADTTLDRLVALKFLEVRGPAETERFRREARFAARLDHPSIVRVYELDEHHGRPYIAMQYVDGQPLGGAGADRATVLRSARQAARALGHAHNTGLVHRDVKPENILVDAEGRAFVTDFGIARDISADAGATLSDEGAIVGTPALMAPEQARGDHAAIDARTDIYGLGATLYTVVTGRHPFVGANVIEVLRQVLRGDRPPSPRSIDPTIDASVENLIERCMCPQSSDRYSGMADVVADLDRALADETVAPGGGGWFFAQIRDRVQPVAQRRTEQDMALVLDVAHELASWDQRLYRISGNLPSTWPRLDALRDRLDEVLTARPDFALARLHRGLVLFRRGMLDQALDDVERAIDRVGDLPSAYFELGRLQLAIYLRDRRAAKSHVAQSGIDERLADIRGRLTRAERAFQSARSAGKSLDTWQFDFTRAFERLADGDAEGCVAHCDVILADDPDLDAVWRLRGDALRECGADPCESYERAVGVRRSDHESLLAWADWLAGERRIDEAQRVLERTLTVIPGDAETLALRASLALAAGAENAVELAAEATGSSPDSYAAAVAHADALLARGHEPDLGLALDEIARARRLPGCPNRLDLLTAEVRLARVALVGDAHGDVARLHEYVEQDRGADSPQWPPVLERIRAL